MYYTVDMVFRKKHIECFVKALSINKQVVEFEKRDKLNAIVKSFLVKPDMNYRPIFGKDVVKILIPENNRDSRANMILPNYSWKLLEERFEQIFYMLYMNIEATGKFSNKYRKELRIKFLHAFNITDEVMNEDSFRKSFDRYCEKMNSKVIDLMGKSEFKPVSIYKLTI